MVSNTSNRNLTQQLVHELGTAIVQGKYTREKSLPSEAEICAQYNISRTATREAVKMLAAKGLLISRPRQGITIQHKDQWNMFDTDVLGWILHGTPSLSMLRDFSQLRLAIEPEAAALAAVNADAEHIEKIEQALARMKNAEQGLDDVLEADIDFHSSVLFASKNPFIVQLRSFIETALRVSIRFTNRLKGVAAADYDDHKKIYQAIVDGDVEAARESSRHLQVESLELIEKALAEDKQKASA